ncbi:MAG TPA: histidine phosphatase family protein [Ktedonobacteraceae bacterium]
MKGAKKITGLKANRPAPRRIWLVRHGMTEWNTQQRYCGHSDIPLSREGRLQAHWLARYLRAVNIGAIYSSDLWRAYETAEIITSKRELALPIQASAAWREIHFGTWEGLTYVQIAASFPEHLDFFTHPEQIAPPGGETLESLQQRVLVSLAQIVDEQAEDILIVSHGGPLRVLLSSCLGMSLARQWQISIDPGSLSALDLVAPSDSQVPLGTLALLNLQESPVLHI